MIRNLDLNPTAAGLLRAGLVTGHTLAESMAYVLDELAVKRLPTGRPYHVRWVNSGWTGVVATDGRKQGRDGSG